ncbi:NUDIX domain-containing protein [Leekyejoonella antrihumi]|uniref:NUDIX domain-containing protein n=1 Tax=Leekyejoonella antrihumi TaxID=1660198 RepID=A0A563E5B6_9MICO|nr:NUDIX domain-containing protein [Leekyejoonella antrihumi]
MELGPRIARGATLKLGAIAAVRRDNLLLLTRREDNGLWCLPGGGVDAGESWAEAAVREVREETGLDIEVTSVLGVYTNPGQVVVYADGRRRQIFGVCFRAQVRDGTAGLSDEVTEVRWVTKDEAAGLPIVPLHRDLVPQAFEAPDAPTTFV